MEENAAESFMSKRKGSALTEKKRKKEIPPGSLMKALIRPGGGSTYPQEGDQITFHYTTRTENGVIVESTRSEYGGHDDAVERDRAPSVPEEPEIPWLDDDTLNALDRETLCKYIKMARDAYLRLQACIDQVVQDKGKGIALDQMQTRPGPS